MNIEVTPGAVQVRSVGVWALSGTPGYFVHAHTVERGTVISFASGLDHRGILLLPVNWEEEPDCIPTEVMLWAETVEEKALFNRCFVMEFDRSSFVILPWSTFSNAGIADNTVLWWEEETA